MAWVESHQSLGNHPKVKRAMRLLGIGRPQLIGHLHLLWHWSLEYAEIDFDAQRGYLDKYEPEDLADAAEWEGDPDLFVSALIDCGPGGDAGFLEYVDGRLMLHDWWDYAGKFVAQRKADAERKRAGRRPNAARPTDIRRTSDGHPADGGKNPNGTLTVPNPNTTQPTEPSTPNARTRASKPSAEAIETAEILVQAAWVRDEANAVAAAVERSFALVKEFRSRDGPLVAEKYCRARKYAKSPPDDWYRAWLNFLKIEVRDDERQPAGATRGARPADRRSALDPASQTRPDEGRASPYLNGKHAAGVERL